MQRRGCEYYSILGMPPVYEIDKGQLKSAYYSLSKSQHPDVTNNDGNSSASLNSAYTTLSDDFLRARLFTNPGTPSPEFLMDCLELETRIRGGEDLRPLLRERIRECTQNYSNPVSLAQWAYYRRLHSMACECFS